VAVIGIAGAIEADNSVWVTNAPHWPKVVSAEI